MCVDEFHQNQCMFFCFMTGDPKSDHQSSSCWRHINFKLDVLHRTIIDFTKGSSTWARNNFEIPCIRSTYVELIRDLQWVWHEVKKCLGQVLEKQNDSHESKPLIKSKPEITASKVEISGNPYDKSEISYTFGWNPFKTEKSLNIQVICPSD